MTDSRRELGAQGELRAERYLRSRGYRIAGRNVRTGGVELDLVAVRGRRVIFVEVKTRRNSRYGSASSAVDVRKQARIARGAAAWLRSEPRWRFDSVRFDVITCHYDESGDGAWHLEHWPGAFDAP